MMIAVCLFVYVLCTFALISYAVDYLMRITLDRVRNEVEIPLFLLQMSPLSNVLSLNKYFVSHPIQMIVSSQVVLENINNIPCMI